MNKYIPYNITCPLASCSRSKRSSTQSPAGTPGGRLSFLMPGGKSALYTYNKKDNNA